MRLDQHAMAIGTNPERNRSHNRRVVLDVVRRFGPLGRMAIARRARLSAQAVANIVGELVDEGLLIQGERLRAGRGQPPIQFQVNPDGGVTAGIEIAAGRMTTVLVDMGGRVRAHRTSSLMDPTPDAIVPILRAEIAGVRESVSEAMPPLLGVGIVMPGPFNVEEMTSAGPTALASRIQARAGEFVRHDLTDRQALDSPLVIENDATAAAVGEHLHGAARDLQDFCLVYFGEGIGLGIVVNGRPLRGAYGNAGEIGHIIVDPSGPLCACGQRGCLEAFASLHALRRRLAAVGLDRQSDADLERLHLARHPVVAAWVREAASRLAPQIAALENILDPQAIVIGGALPPALLVDLMAALQPLPTSVARRRGRRDARLIQGRTGHLIAALGAAALPLLETMTPRLDTASTVSVAIRSEEKSVA
jgi:predicted NBD/HSP70 family sugar kinase